MTINAPRPGTLMVTKIVIGRYQTRDTLEDGVRNAVRLAVHPTLNGVTGQYFNKVREGPADPQAYDIDARARLRDLGERLCQEKA